MFGSGMPPNKKIVYDEEALEAAPQEVADAVAARLQEYRDEGAMVRSIVAPADDTYGPTADARSVDLSP